MGASHQKAELRVVQGGLAPAAPTRPVLDDSELLAALKRGDASAATAFFDRTRPLIDRVIGRMLGRHDADHDDMAQIAVLESLNSMDNFRGDCSLDTWVSRITARVIYKEFGKRKKARGVFVSEDDMTRHGVQGTESSVFSRSLLRRLQGLLDAMDPAKAWTYVLHDVCGHDLQEVAKMTDASVSAAQTRLSRGRRELVTRIEEDADLATLLAEERHR